MPKLLARRTEWGLLLAIGGVIALTAWLDRSHNYLNDPWTNAENILRQTTLLGIFALGSAVVIISGGIDLSCGSMIAFSGTICASLLLWLAPERMQSTTEPLGIGVIALAISGALVAGLLVGSLHAWLINVIGLPPFIATLASLVGLRSLGRALIPQVTRATLGRESNQIQLFDEQFRYLANSVWIPTVVFLFMALAIWFLLARTVMGRHLYALGGNEQAARLSGIRTDRLKWLAYCIGALCSSVAGIFYIAEQATADPQALGVGYELNSIAAAVVGGCSLQGGIGTIPGTVLGALFLRTVIHGVGTVIKTGADNYEGAIVGILVVVAVAISQLRTTTGQTKKFFAGALGAVVIATLTLVSAMLAGFLVGRNAALGTGATVAALLVLFKWFESRR
jgi:ribose/xylose/arabinose/galactoside ABC-type transport system permease subunit